MAETTLQGNICHTVGELPSVGQTSPLFCLQDFKLADKSRASFKKDYLLIYVVPSLDTMVCAKTTKKLNELAIDLSNVDVVVASADLPFAQQRFFKQNKIKNITALSMMRDRQFAEDFGVRLKDGALAGLTARAVFVIDKNNKITHSEMTPDITHDPEFETVIKAISDQ